MGDNGTKPRILLVDDERAVWQILGEKLGRSGFDWRGRLSGGDALACLEQEPIDAVVSDLKMPGMTGLELLAETQKRYPHVAF
ncbi:MAG TPA: response regulator, partial [Terriglobales bacterium]|nr:response regulator [Terriglobales bacterium]